MREGSKTGIFDPSFAVSTAAIGSVGVESLVIMARLFGSAGNNVARLRMIPRGAHLAAALFPLRGNSVKRRAAAARTSKTPCLSRLPAIKAGNPTKALCRAKAFALIQWMSPRHFAAR